MYKTLKLLGNVVYYGSVVGGTMYFGTYDKGLGGLVQTFVLAMAIAIPVCLLKIVVYERYLDRKFNQPVSE